VYTVLNTYSVELYERFKAAGYELTERHEMGAILAHDTRNRPLLGFAKRHRTDDPKIQRELNIALSYHVRAGNDRGVNLCLWAGADPHAPAPNSDSGFSDDADTEDGEERFIGWTAMQEAARQANLAMLKRLGPDPSRDDFDDLYRAARYEFIVAFLATIQPPKDLTAILSWHCMWLEDRFPWASRTGTGAIEALLASGVRWDERDAERLSGIRRSLLKSRDDDIRRIFSRLMRPEICSPETYEALVRTPRIQERLPVLGLQKKPVSERARKKDGVSRLMHRYDRKVLYNQVWSQPVQEVAKS
jgi:hypothetical protein